MVRGLLVAAVIWTAVSAQNLPVLRLRASVDDGKGGSVPVARHMLLISDIPVSAAPRVVTTSLDGTAEVRLPPGKYIIEDDHALVLQGRASEWVRTLDVAAGRDATLALTAANATVSAASADAIREAAAATEVRDRLPVSQPASILATWQGSAVGIWTSHTHAAGVVVDASGLVVTSRQAIGAASTVEVQIGPSLKVAGLVLGADAVRDVAVIRVHESAVQGVRPVPVDCAVAVPESDRYAIDVPMFGPKDIRTSLAATTGGPVFDGDARLVGLLAEIDAVDAASTADVVVVPVSRVCEALATARGRLAEGPTPDAARLPVEPDTRVSRADVRGAALGRAFGLGSYQTSTADFDITWLTPVLFSLAEGRRGWSGVRADELNGLRVATEFENWRDYVEEAPPLVYVRVTPRLVEGFWMKLARGAASLQGAQIPPLKRLRPGFSAMRLLCGGREIAPVHPFKIQSRVSETDAIDEGFYAFDPAEITTACGSVSLVLSSVKDPSRTETRTIDAAIIRRVQDDFAAIRP